MVRKKITVVRMDSFRREVLYVRGGASAPSPGERPWDEPWAPLTDVCEMEDRVLMKMELAGVDPGDISLVVHHNRVEISGVKRRERHRGPTRYHRLERPSGVFRRVVSLPCVVVPDSARAVLDHGVLSLVLLKASGGRFETRREDASLDDPADLENKNG